MAEQQSMVQPNPRQEGAFNPGIGFVDPVFESQAAFRSILTALSEPGTLLDLGPRMPCPAGLFPATATFLLAMADYETPVWMPEPWQQGEAGAWLRFHCGAPAAEPGQAAFAVGSPAMAMPSVADFNPGTDLYPDQSTTLILQLEALEGGSPMEIEGPGIPGTRRIAPIGLPADFADVWARNHKLYPLGVDLLLAAGSRILGLPRSTRIHALDPRA